MMWIVGDQDTHLCKWLYASGWKYINIC